MFIPTRKRLAGCILHLIMRQRNGGAIDEGLVKKVVDSFVSLGLDDSEVSKVCLDDYEEHFEAAFIDVTEKYYKGKSESFLAENSISDYLKKTAEWLREEEDRVERYLNVHTRQMLLNKCVHVLIQEHSGLMSKWVQSIIDSEKYEDLECVSALQFWIPDALEFLRTTFGEHVKKTGLAAVSKLVEEVGANVDEVAPKAYVDALLDVLKKTWEPVPMSLRRDARLLAGRGNAGREFINRNAATGTSNSKSPELLARYADQLLRKNNRIVEDGDLQRGFKGVVSLYFEVSRFINGLMAWHVDRTVRLH
jgi:cullin 1